MKLSSMDIAPSEFVTLDFDIEEHNPYGLTSAFGIDVSLATAILSSVASIVGTAAEWKGVELEDFQLAVLGITGHRIRFQVLGKPFLQDVLDVLECHARGGNTYAMLKHVDDPWCWDGLLSFITILSESFVSFRLTAYVVQDGELDFTYRIDLDMSKVNSLFNLLLQIPAPRYTFPQVSYESEV